MLSYQSRMVRILSISLALETKCFLERSALQHTIPSCIVEGGDDARGSHQLKPGKHVRIAGRSDDATLTLVYNSSLWYRIRHLSLGVRRVVAAEMDWDNIHQ